MYLESTVTGYLTSCQILPGQDDKLAALTVGQRITVWGESNMELGFESDNASDWIVRSMDDETVFGVEFYRKSYVEAVRNG